MDKQDDTGTRPNGAFPDHARHRHDEGAPPPDEQAKGGPPGDDRLASETAHVNESKPEDDHKRPSTGKGE